jgi:hypothetical protein
MGANLFDGIQVATYNIVLNTMGYVATWIPSNGSGSQSGLVLFNQPTQREDISDEEYAAVSTKLEYLAGVFPGLYEAISGGSSEPLTVAGLDFYGYKADRKFDGKTIIVHLEPKR